MKRTAFLAGTAALPLAASAQSLTQITVASAPNDDLIGVLWGIESGAFRKAGLDVSLQKVQQRHGGRCGRRRRRDRYREIEPDLAAGRTLEGLSIRARCSGRHL